MAGDCALGGVGGANTPPTGDFGTLVPSPGTAAHREAADYIQEHLRQAGFAVEEAAFQEADFSGTNLLTLPAPKQADLPLLIVGAHYDSLPTTPGADDNASGVAALLELASML